TVNAYPKAPSTGVSYAQRTSSSRSSGVRFACSASWPTPAALARRRDRRSAAPAPAVAAPTVPSATGFPPVNGSEPGSNVPLDPPTVAPEPPAGFAAGLCSAARTCGPGDVGVLVGVVAGVTGVEPACPNAATSNVRTIGTPATTTPATAPRRKNSRRVCRSILPAPRPRAGESTRKSPKWTDRRRGTRCRDRGTGVVPAVARGHAMSPRDASRLLPRERARPRDVRDDAAGADERLARVAEDGHELPVVRLQERA